MLYLINYVFGLIYANFYYKMFKKWIKDAIKVLLFVEGLVI